MGSTFNLLREIENELQKENEHFDFDKFVDLKQDLNEKIESIVSVFRKYDWLMDSAKKEAVESAQRQKYYENQGKKLKWLLNMILERSWKDKIETGKVRLGTRKSSTIDIIDSTNIPSEFIKNITTIKDLDMRTAEDLEVLLTKSNVSFTSEEKIDKIWLKTFASDVDKKHHHQYWFEIIEKKNIQIK